MTALIVAFNQEKALVWAFSVIVKSFQPKCAGVLANVTCLVTGQCSWCHAGPGLVTPTHSAPRQHSLHFLTCHVSRVSSLQKATGLALHSDMLTLSETVGMCDGCFSDIRPPTQGSPVATKLIFKQFHLLPETVIHMPSETPVTCV